MSRHPFFLPSVIVENLTDDKPRVQMIDAAPLHDTKRCVPSEPCYGDGCPGFTEYVVARRMDRLRRFNDIGRTDVERTPFEPMRSGLGGGMFGILSHKVAADASKKKR